MERSSKEHYRLALDLGSNSIGWIVMRINDGWPCRIEDAGVRIFPTSRGAGKNGVYKPLSVVRRNVRSQRRRRDRFLMRKSVVLKLLRENHLLPTDSTSIARCKSLDPYKLRHEALCRPLSPIELGRVLLHLSQRRGFQSNRKNLAKDEGGKSLSGSITALEKAISDSGCATLGSFLYLQKQKGLPIRMRAESGYYPNRLLYQKEFDAIRELQKENFSNILPESWERIKHALFFQRELRKPVPGYCRLFPEKLRAPRALPSFQRFRMLQQLANLKILDSDLTKMPLLEEQREKLIKKLSSSKELKFDDARKLLNIERSFNLEGSSKGFRAAKVIFGDRTSHLLSSRNYFGPLWKKLSEAQQDEVVLRILSEESEDELRRFLDQFQLTEAQLDRIVALDDERFEKGYGEFSEEALREINKYLEKNYGATYDQAVAHLGFHHSDSRPSQRLKQLPYYGAALRDSVVKVPGSPVEDERIFGKISNPTVHVALNQLRKVVNALLERYGNIEEIIVEVARELPLGERGLSALAKEIKENEKQNERYARRLEEELGLPNTYRNRLRLRLWEELGEEPLSRRCPYSGEVIGIEKLFSPAVEIDHILPKSKTFSNHHSNLVVCIKSANKYKGDRSPFEAFSGPGSPYPYDEIKERIRTLPLNKQMKFAPDALEKFSQRNSFLERQLNDTRFISKAARRYLELVCPKVFVSRGQLTAFIRSEMNLNRLLSQDGKKNRNDYRHHAVDAFILGFCTPQTLPMLYTRLNRSGATHAEEELPRLIANFKRLLEGLVVSHRVDHSVNTKLFKDNAYGFLESTNQLVRRVPLQDVSEIAAVKDERIRRFMQENCELENGELAQLVFQKFGAKKVKILDKNSSAVPIMHPSTNPRFTKWLIPAEVVRLEVWRIPSRVGTELVVLPVNAPMALKGAVTKPHPAAKKLFTIHKGDTLRFSDHNGEERTVVVKSLKPGNKKIQFQDHNLARTANAIGNTLVFSRFVERGVRLIHVNELGEVRDSGPWWVDGRKNRRDSKPGSLPKRGARALVH